MYTHTITYDTTMIPRDKLILLYYSMKHSDNIYIKHDNKIIAVVTDFELYNNVSNLKITFQFDTKEMLREYKYDFIIPNNCSNFSHFYFKERDEAYYRYKNLEIIINDNV